MVIALLRQGDQSGPLCRITRARRALLRSSRFRSESGFTGRRHSHARAAGHQRELARTRAAELGASRRRRCPLPTRGRVYLGVPILKGDEACGVIALYGHERENAFGESDVRLLQTLANSMSIALENARLFDETQRLLQGNRAARRRARDHQQRAGGARRRAQHAGIYDAVGDKIREIFHQADVDIAHLRPADKFGPLPIPYYRARQTDRHRVIAARATKASARTCLRTRETLVINENMAPRVGRKYRQYSC